MSDEDFATITIDGRKLSKHTPANPAPLGFIAVGLTIVFYCFYVAGLYELNSLVFTLGLIYGGITLLIVSAMEFKNGNTFGTVAFGLYGIYWISDMLIIVFGKMGWVTSSDITSIAIFYFIWGLFTLGIFVGTLKLSRPVQAFFLTLTILFFLLTGWVLNGDPTLALITGVEGIICGAIGVYIGLGEVLNDLFGNSKSF